ncbi:MAG: phosphatidate cytidylyltransferase [Promethearchaeota archaeon]
MFIHIIKTWNSENKNGYKKLNEVIYALLTVAFALFYPFIILRFGGNKQGIIFPNAVDELSFLGNIFIVGVMIGVSFWGISAKLRTIRNPELLIEQHNYELFCKEFLEKYSERSQIKRRITHILPGAVVGLCIIIVYYFFFDLLGSAWIDYAMFIIIIIGIDFALTFIAQDLIRLFDFSYMPPTAIKMCKAGLTPDELDSFSSTSIMVFSFGPFIFFIFPIFFIVILITSVADAMASMIGILSGNKKHHFPKSTNKSIEGYIGGFIFTFICTVFAVVFSNHFQLSNWGLELTLFIAFMLSIVFVLIDLLTSKIELQDNYLNPFIIGFVLILILIAAKISIF